MHKSELVSVNTRESKYSRGWISFHLHKRCPGLFVFRKQFCCFLETPKWCLIRIYYAKKNRANRDPLQLLLLWDTSRATATDAPGAAPIVDAAVAAGALLSNTRSIKQSNDYALEADTL